MCLLQKSYRFDQHSNIGIMARAVNAGDEHQVRQVLQDAHPAHCLPLAQEEDYQHMLAKCVAGYSDYLQIADSSIGLQAVAQGVECRTGAGSIYRFRLLCALRDGPFSVASLNMRIEQALQQARIDPSQP
ncbi:MAG: hypothetical protein ACR5K7_06265 [Symbiopectobacterium sp.]